jgi:hypothetical protein
MTSVEGTINGFPFQATLEPDGQKSHWLKVDRKMREAADVDAGDVVTLQIAPAAEQLESKVPARAEIGSFGSPPPNRSRLARVGSKMPVRCSRPGRNAFAASIGPGSMLKASAHLKRRTSNHDYKNHLKSKSTKVKLEIRKLKSELAFGSGRSSYPR